MRFNEVVRLGEDNEKHQELLNQITVQYENRIQTLEQRLMQQEQSSLITEKKGDSSQNFLNDVMERVESKL